MSRTQVVRRGGRAVLLPLAAVTVFFLVWVAQTAVDGGKPHQPLADLQSEHVAVGSGTTMAATTISEPLVSKGSRSRGEVLAKLHLPAGACRLQADAEGNVVGTCALQPAEPVGSRLNPFGGSAWNTP